MGFSQISYRAFPFHLIFLSKFSVERRAFRKLYNFGCSGNFAGKFPYHLSVFRNFQSFWLNGKCPIFPRFLYTIESDLHLISVECATSNSYFFFYFIYLISISLVSLQLLEHMLRPLAKIYPMEWRSVLVDFGTPPTEHLFIRVRFCTRLTCVSQVRITSISPYH